jgi:hypothetical protein
VTLLFRMFFVSLPQNRHPERRSSPIYHVIQRLWRSAQDDDSVGVSTKNTLSKLARMRHRRTLLSSRPQWRNLQFPATVSEGGFRLLHVVFHSLDRVAKNLFQAHGRQTVGLAEVFVDLIPVIHPWSGKAD